MAARCEGGDFAAPWLFEGTCNTDLFNGWLESQLCPWRHSQHVVILDNAAFHPSAKTRDLVARTGATLLYLPPYSPDLNPIEHDFANLKKIREYNEQTSLDSLVKMYN